MTKVLIPCKIWAPPIVPMLVIYNGTELYNIAHDFIDKYNTSNHWTYTTCLWKSVL